MTIAFSTNPSGGFDYPAGGGAGMAYQVGPYDSKWNEVRDCEGSLLYMVNKRARQIYRIAAGYMSGPASLFLGDNVTGSSKGKRWKNCAGDFQKRFHYDMWIFERRGK